MRLVVACSAEITETPTQEDLESAREDFEDEVRWLGGQNPGVSIEIVE